MTGELQAEIERLLQALATEGVSCFIATQEPGKEIDCTRNCVGEPLAMDLAWLFACKSPNVDAAIIAILRYCRLHDVDTGESMVLRRYDKKE